jgi:hypothetical protein
MAYCGTPSSPRSHYLLSLPWRALFITGAGVTGGGQVSQLSSPAFMINTNVKLLVPTTV